MCECVSRPLQHGEMGVKRVTTVSGSSEYMYIYILHTTAAAAAASDVCEVGLAFGFGNALRGGIFQQTSIAQQTS